MYNNEKYCKECNKKRFANTSWCFHHYKEREKRKKQAKIMMKIEKKSKTKGFIEKTRKQMMKIAWGLMSQWIRRNDANLDGFAECYTCGCIKHYKDMDCGHFRHDRLDLDERNLKVQCSKCNRYLSGNLAIYSYNLIRDFGLDWFNQLNRDANAYQKYTVPEIASIIRDLKEKLNNLN